MESTGKIHWPSGLAVPSAVKVPDSVAAEAGKEYMPGGRVTPPRSDEGRGVTDGKADGIITLLYAKRQAASAAHANVPPADFVPVHTPGGKPVIEMPGQVPQSPVMTVLPELVMVVPAIAPNFAATPNETASVMAG